MRHLLRGMAGALVLMAASAGYGEDCPNTAALDLLKIG